MAADALPGKTEGEYFLGRKFFEIAQSSQRKVRIMVEVARRAADGTLKTNMRWYRSPLVALAGFIDLLLDNIWVRGATLLLAANGLVALVHNLYRFFF